jgi:hypothetical protein
MRSHHWRISNITRLARIRFSNFVVTILKTTTLAFASPLFPFILTRNCVAEAVIDGCVTAAQHLTLESTWRRQHFQAVRSRNPTSLSSAGRLLAPGHLPVALGNLVQHSIDRPEHPIFRGKNFHGCSRCRHRAALFSRQDRRSRGRWCHWRSCPSQVSHGASQTFSVTSKTKNCGVFLCTCLFSVFASSLMTFLLLCALRQALSLAPDS